MTTYKRADFAKAQQEAYTTLGKANVTSLPVDLRNIIAQYPNLSLMKYSAVAEAESVSVEELAYLLDSEEGCLYYQGGGQYVIFYNDTVKHNQRVRFTIAHELGHYILNHLGEKETNIARYSLTEIQSESLEQEANYFAKRLLAPIPAVDLYVKYYNKVTRKFINSAFDVSYQMSGYVIEDLRRRHENTRGVLYELHELQDHFQDFVYRQVKLKECLTCNACDIDEDSSYCPVCGSEKLMQFDMDTFYLMKDFGGINVNYRKIDVNDYSRANICPECENEEIEDHEEVCMICGKYIRNICSGVHLDDNYTDVQMAPNQLEGCQVNLKGNARHCTKCGAMSTFFYYDILKHWSYEHKEVNEQVPF